MDYQERYKKLYAEVVINNFKKVKNDLIKKDKGLLKKIKKRALEFGLTTEQIIKDIKSCDTAVIPFAVSPAKQNIYEKIASQMIRSMAGIDEFKDLPNNDLYISNGTVFEKNELKQYPRQKH